MKLIIPVSEKYPVIYRVSESCNKSCTITFICIMVYDSHGIMFLLQGICNGTSIVAAPIIYNNNFILLN